MNKLEMFQYILLDITKSGHFDNLTFEQQVSGSLEILNYCWEDKSNEITSLDDMITQFHKHRLFSDYIPEPCYE